MINFDTDKLIILYYPPWAGGKFLANCIGLSNSAFFQSAYLVEKQLENNFSIEDKKNYLLSQISEVNNEWNDLNLNCKRLFGVNYFSIDQNIIVDKKIKNLFNFNEVVEKISSNNKYFFRATHTYKELKIDKEFWPNAKIIYFYNYDNFITHYRPNFKPKFDKESRYQLVRGADWPKHYPELDLYLNLSAYIKKDIGYYFEEFLTVDTIKNISDCIIYKWNTDNYLSFDQTYFGLTEIYKILGISDVDKQTIKSYYDSWINKLTELKNNNKELE